MDSRIVGMEENYMRMRHLVLAVRHRDEEDATTCAHMLSAIDEAIMEGKPCPSYPWLLASAKAAIRGPGEFKRDAVGHMYWDVWEPGPDELPSEIGMDTIEWHRSRDGSAGLSSTGLTMEELEEMLLTLAADVHERRTGVRAGGLIIKTGQTLALYGWLMHYQRGSSEEFDLLAEAVDKLHQERDLK